MRDTIRVRFIFALVSVLFSCLSVVTACEQPFEPPAPPSSVKPPSANTTTTTTTTAPQFQPPEPPGAAERRAERAAMVEQQIAKPFDYRRRIESPLVLRAMSTVPRHAFVPADLQNRAYDDTPLPIGHGQTISQPYVVALMTELLELTPESKVLEIGTGSGYQAAVLAQLTLHVFSIEIVEPLATQGERALREQGYDGVRCRHGDGYFGWAEEAPFDAIIVTCASGHLPPPLWEQLKPGGRIAIPIGGPYEMQRLVVIHKQEDGSRRSETITSVRFVPMTRQDQ